MADLADKKKILLVDDNEISLVIAATLLAGNYEITSVKSGKEALHLLLHEYKPDLILLDILMPDMDGWETFHKIRGISLLNQVPIAFLTSINDAEKIKYSYQIGAADFITKPYDKTELLNRVDKIFAGMDC